MPELSDDLKSSATRLCAACGMCCNGVLFASVRLRPTDTARTFTVLGLKLKSRRDGLHLPQPCAAHDGSSCTIYDQRPHRCRVFACRQLAAVTEGKISEDEALVKIAEARTLTDRVRDLLRLAGDTRDHKPLAKRYETLFLPPVDPEPAATAAREQLVPAMLELETLLARDFRVEPADPEHAAD